MKTKTLELRGTRAGGKLLGLVRGSFCLGSALLLAAYRLVAMPSVATISGGPTAGYVNGDTAAAAMFNTPVGLALDKTSSLLYVADRGNNAIRQLDLASGQTITFASYGVNVPVGVVVDDDGNVFVLNRGNGSNGTVVEYDIFGDYLGIIASGLINAQGIARDSIGDLYVTVQGNTVLQIAPDGSQNVITVVPVANTLLRGIAVMDSGFLAVADFNNDGIYVIDPTSGNFSVLTGFNGAGDHFGTKPFVKLNQPYGIAAAGNGFLVVADYGNNRVKVVDPSGTVTNLYGVNSSFWLTGSGTYPGWADGTVCRGDVNYNAAGCVEARLPVGVVFAKDGTVYTSEDYYHLIRKVGSTGLPQHPAPLPPVPAPTIGWVDFTLPPNVVVSILRTAQPFVFNNDVKIEIQGTQGTETHFTAGTTPAGIDTIPDPSATVGSTPPTYFDGMFPSQVPNSIISQIEPDITIKAIGVQSGRPSSLVVSARFQFKVANPSIDGNNAALFTVTDQTTNSEMWYTTDGSDPVRGGANSTKVLSGATLSLNAASDVEFKIQAFRDHYQDSDIVSKTFTADGFVPNSISFGFGAGEASSDFVGAPGQFFYAPVTLSIVPGTKMYSLQFNLVVTNAGINPGPPVPAGAFRFVSTLEKPIPNSNPVIFETIPPAMFSAYAQNPPPANQLIFLDNMPFVNMTFVDAGNNLLGVGWLERLTQTNLYDTTKQDLIKYSQPHDTMFDEINGKVVLGGYGFQIPQNALPGQTYQIQIGRPSATSDGIGAPGSDIFVAVITNGSLTAGSQNSIKIVTAGQRKYVVGDSAPFRWYNAGDFGDTNLNNSDVMQVFQSAIYGFDAPPAGSDFFDSMDSCGYTYSASPGGYLVPANPVANLNVLFDGNDTSINQIAFGDGNLDVCDVYVTFRRSLDPSLGWFQRFWTNGIRAAEAIGNPPPAPQNSQPKPLALQSGAVPSVKFASADFRATAGQTLQIPITAQILGNYPLRVLMLNLSVNPLDGSPALTAPVRFSPSPALGQPALTSSKSYNNYGASWLNSGITGLTSNAVLGTLTVTIPANAGPNSAYAIHFDHASASPNGLAAFAATTATGLITLGDRSVSSFNDGISDAWRLRYFGSIYNLLSQATADADGDGANNWQEYVAGTDPTSAQSLLTVSTHQAAALQTQDCVVHWPSIVGKTYIIERSSSIFQPNWVPVSTTSGTGADMEFHDNTGGAVRFYRVRVAP
jgi:hypothetical protein